MKIHNFNSLCEKKSSFIFSHNSTRSTYVGLTITFSFELHSFNLHPQFKLTSCITPLGTARSITNRQRQKHSNSNTRNIRVVSETPSHNPLLFADHCSLTKTCVSVTGDTYVYLVPISVSHSLPFNCRLGIVRLSSFNI